MVNGAKVIDTNKPVLQYRYVITSGNQLTEDGEMREQPSKETKGGILETMNFTALIGPAYILT